MKKNINFDFLSIINYILIAALILGFFKLCSIYSEEEDEYSYSSSSSSSGASTQTTTPQNANLNALEVIFIDVGEADATLVLSGDQAMLIDAGIESSSEIILDVLDQKNVNRLDYVVATHGHEDHVGGFYGVLDQVEFDSVLSPIAEYDSSAFYNFLQALEIKGKSITIPEETDYVFTLGLAEVEILCMNAFDDPDNCGMVLKVSYEDTSVLIMGDAKTDVEEYLLANEIDVSADVIRLGLHGSKESSSEAFLEAVNPSYAVISCGENGYGHPSQSVLDALYNKNIQLCRTDLQSHITFTSNGTTFSGKVSKATDEDLYAGY